MQAEADLPGGRNGFAAALRLTAQISIAVGVLLSSPGVSAAPGDTLFSDSFNGNLNRWNVISSGGNANIDNKTASQGRSLELRWGNVAVESDDIDASVAAAAQFSAWIRRGSDSFGEDPDAGEDIFVEFRDAGGSWNTLIP